MTTLDAGQAVPDVTFKVRADTDWVDVTSDDLFKGKTVVVLRCQVRIRRPVRQHMYHAITSLQAR
jgi:hypothetical protein